MSARSAGELASSFSFMADRLANPASGMMPW